jgi:hypothetical protein
LSLDQGLFMVAWRNPFGLASHPRCSAPHESSRDSFQLCRACSSSMASAIVERSVVGVIESRGAVLCLGCGVVSGMGSGVRFSVDAKRARPSSMLGWKWWKCTAPLQLRNVWLGSCGSLLSPVAVAVAVWHQCTPDRDWLCVTPARLLALRSVHWPGVKRRCGPLRRSGFRRTNSSSALAHSAETVGRSTLDTDQPIYTKYIHTYILSSRHGVCSPLAIACTYPDNAAS